MCVVGVAGSPLSTELFVILVLTADSFNCHMTSAQADIRTRNIAIGRCQDCSINSYYATRIKLKNLRHFDLFQRPSSEESWYSVLLDIDAMTSRRVKKAVVCMAELIHGLLTFLMDVNGLFDPPGCVI